MGAAASSREPCRCSRPAAPDPGPPKKPPKKPPCIVIVPIPAGRCARPDVGATARLSGWCHRVRDHGGVLFIDLRDHYGVTQCVVDADSAAFKAAEGVRSEWVVRIDGRVRQRPAGNRERRPADRRGRGLHHRSRSAGSGGRAADAGLRRSRLPGGDPAQVPLPGSAPGEAARQHHEARGDHRFAAPARMREGGFSRVPDPDPDRLVAGGRPRLPGCRRGCIRASSTPLPRRRSSSSSSR